MQRYVTDIRTGQGQLVAMTADEVAAFVAEREPRDYAQEIKEHRNRAMASGVVVGGNLIHTDDISQQRIIGATLAALRDPTLVVNWKTASGTFVQLDAPAIFAVASAVRAHVQKCFDHEAALLAELAAAADPDTVDLTAGWPGPTTETN